MDSRHQNGQTDTAIASIPLVCIYRCIRALHDFFSDHCGQKYGHKQSPKLVMHGEDRYFVISNFHCICIFFARKRRQKPHPRYASNPKKLFFHNFLYPKFSPESMLKKLFWLLRIKNSENGAHFCIFKNMVL